MIRLLKRLPGSGLSLESFDDDPPPYAILSHTWDEGQEVTYGELVSGAGKDKSGYAKIEFCVKKAAEDKLQYCWVDTCCIDKSDLIELSTAINSMFRWYHRATKCYALLSNVQVPAEVADPQAFRITWEAAFRQSRWFKRGWTLQELIAPSTIDFYSAEYRFLGSKISLEQEIHEITGIPVIALRAYNLSDFSVEDRMSWVAGRQTKWKEDKIYCLFGILGVFLAPIYGEGEEYATERLQDEIQRRQAGRGTTSLQDLIVSSSLPFPRNKHFVGRESQLQALERFMISENDERMTICGLGGCGKSALAIEFAYRTLARGGWLVLWVPAITRQGFEDAYREIGTRLQIPGISDDNADVKKLVKDRLSLDSVGNWLIVVDNADDPAVLLGDDDRQDPDRLYDFIPYSRKGKVVFTTRSAKVAEDLTPGDVIELSDMSTDKDEAQQLFERRISRPALIADTKAVIELLEILTFLPLAIVQAAAYINKNRTPVSRYISLFRGTDAEKGLFGKHFEDTSRYRDMDRTVARTWYISFKQIQKDDALAAEYLSILACIDRLNIPESLLPQSVSPIGHDEALGTLQAYAFIVERQQQPEAERCFDMHRLVHLASAWWLEESNQQSAWISKVAARLEMLIPYGGHESRKVWTRYLSHGMYISKAEGKLDEIRRASILERVGWCQANLSQYRGAEIAYQQVVEIRKGVLGVEHPDTLSSMGILALTYNKQGRYKQAEELFVQVIESRKRVPGAEHSDTLTSMANLASIYSNQGRWKDAEELGMQVLETRKKVFGAEHPDTLTSMNNLAAIYGKLRRRKESEELHVQVLEVRRKMLGVEHPDTLASMHHLAVDYTVQQRWKEAEKLGIQVMNERKKVLGPDHGHSLDSIRNLAKVFEDQSLWKEAEELRAQVVGIYKRVLGWDHPYTLSSVRELVVIYRHQNRWKEAEKLGEQLVETCKRALGAEHSDTLTSMANLASTYNNQGRWKEAEELQAQLLEVPKRLLKAEHPDTLIRIVNLAAKYSDQGRWKEAEELFMEVLEPCKKVLGAEHPDTLVSMTYVTVMFIKQRRWKEAEELGVQVLKTCKKVHGPEHPDTLSNMDNLAGTYFLQGRWKEAKELFTQVIESYKKVLGAEHPRTLIAMNNLALTFSKQERLKEAEELQVQVVETSKRVLGEEHPDTLNHMHVLTVTYRRHGHLQEAEKLGMQLIEKRKRALGPEHVDTLDSMRNSAGIYGLQSRWKEAEGLRAQVVELYKRVLGADHPDTLSSVHELMVIYRHQSRWKEAEELGRQLVETRERALGPEHPDTLKSMNELAAIYRNKGQ